MRAQHTARVPNVARGSFLLDPQHNLNEYKYTNSGSWLCSKRFFGPLEIWVVHPWFQSTLIIQLQWGLLIHTVSWVAQYDNWNLLKDIDQFLHLDLFYSLEWTYLNEYSDYCRFCGCRIHLNRGALLKTTVF